VACRDGVITRRADTLWATLANLEDPLAVREITLPVLHGREEQAAESVATSELQGRSARETAAQVRGTVLARALAAATGTQELLRAREVAVREQRNLASRALDSLPWRELLLVNPLNEPGFDPAAITAGNEVERARAMVEGGLLPGEPAELDAFLARLPDAVRAWRGGW
jgi:hypothetical protein